MKKCVPSLSSRLLAGLTVAFCGAGAILALCQGMKEEESALPLFLIGLFLGGLFLYLLWRTASTRGWGFFYDEETIVFALSRKDRRQFRWEQLQNGPVAFTYPAPPNAGYFYFPDGKKIMIHPKMAGYEPFIAMLKKKGFSAAEPAASFDNVAAKDIFNQMFGEQFGKDGGKKK